VITVGASDDRGTPSPLDDSLAWFSSFGMTQDGQSKPDIVAPGRHIVGALASSGSGLAMQFPSKIIDQRYIQLSGTSAAAPVVSGAVALLLQARPWLTPDQVKWLLTQTARSMATGTGAGGGELDLLAAMRFGSQPQRANLGLTPELARGRRTSVSAERRRPAGTGQLGTLVSLGLRQLGLCQLGLCQLGLRQLGLRQLGLRARRRLTHHADSVGMRHLSFAAQLWIWLVLLAAALVLGLYRLPASARPPPK
jgi:hypothetical protein